MVVIDLIFEELFKQVVISSLGMSDEAIKALSEPQSGVKGPVGSKFHFVEHRMITINLTTTSYNHLVKNVLKLYLNDFRKTWSKRRQPKVKVERT